MRRVLAVGAILVAASGCGAATTIQKVDRDTYRITCREVSLGRCLSESVDNVCKDRAYFVRGISELNRRGTSEAPDIATSSEALVRCASGDNWSYEAKELMAATASGAPAAAVAPKPQPAPAPVVPPPPKAAPICAPGSTQSCVGAGACAGGQACKADGSGFEPCDCGSAEAPR